MHSGNSTLTVVEDNPSDYHLLERIIGKEQLGMRCNWLQDGEAALEWFFKKMTDKPALVLLDINLPKHSGLEVLKALKENPRTKAIPVVVFSTSSHSADITDAYRLGANSYVVKPATYADLKVVLRHIHQFWFVHNETIH